MAAPEEKLILYFDDTGSRNPDHNPDARRDGMDCFGLGGVLLRGEDIPGVWDAHKAFCGRWEIDYPLHSSDIRGGHGKFGWLRKPENSGAFFPELQDYLLAQPVVGIACIIDRPGYVARYREIHRERMWLMCKTAFCILIERAAKYAERQERKLEVFFEQAGKAEDRDLISYMKELKNTGNPFDGDRSGVYAPYSSGDYRRWVLGSPIRKSKKVPMLQLADLLLYPMAKGGYDPEYKPYAALREHRKLIDDFLSEDERTALGIKYSCFPEKQKGPETGP